MQQPPFYVVTGRSGAGKSTALAAFEDAGYYCVDNMPVALMPQFIASPPASRPGIHGFAFGLDLRQKSFLDAYGTVFDTLAAQGHRPVIVSWMPTTRPSCAVTARRAATTPSPMATPT
jgi:UPF0042 nucleotide-binding protein